MIFGPRGTPPTVPGSGGPPVTVGRGGYGTFAGSPEIARASGGDSMSVNDASAVETTFERIRQRYAVYYHLPEGMDSARGLDLDLSNAARRRHPDAALQYRRVGLTQDSGKPGLITRIPAHAPSSRDPEPAQTDADSADSSSNPTHKRRAVNDSSGAPVSLAVQAPPGQTADTDTPKTINRRRGVSDPGSSTPVVITPTTPTQ